MKDLKRQNVDIADVYDAYADTLYRLALSYMQNSEDAQDAVHDVFIKYVSIPVGFTDEEHRKAWLIRVTVNHCNDMLRRRKIRGYIPLDEIAETASAPTEDNDTYDVIKCLEKIPVKIRDTIILHYLEGYSVEETAKILKITVSAVKMRLKRGREALREQISEVE